MATTTEELQRLRTWFIAYYLFNLVIGTWASVVVVDALKTSTLPFMDALHAIPGGVIVAWSLVVGAAFFALGMFLMHHLLLREGWARSIILVIAWITGISALLSLLSVCGSFSASGWLSRAIPGADWTMVGVFSGLTNLASLAYSVLTIRTLQFDQLIRQEFTQPGPGQP